MLQWQKFLPFLRWIPDLKKSGVVQADFIAGITVALVLIPQSMAYAQLANLPAYYGLYAAFLPVITGALFGSSNQLMTGPVAVVSLLTASALAPLAVAGSENFIAYAVLLSLLVGLFQLMLGVFRLGIVLNFLSHPVIIGFTNAAALIIAFSQFYKLFGVNKPETGVFVTDVLDVLSQIANTHLLSFAMAIGAIAIMVVVKRLWPKIPGVLFAVVITIIISYLIDFEGKGGVVVGKIPAGLPTIKLPEFNFDVIQKLIISAIVISLIGFMEAISIAKAMAARTKQRIDVNQELIGQGIANIVGSFSQSYPTSGSFSRSAVNLNAGAITGFSSVVTMIMVLITLLFLTPLLYHLPAAVLASVIMMAVIGLLNFKAIKHAWHAHKHDGIAAGVTFVGTLGFAPHLEWGIVIGASLALGLYLFRTMRPRVAILGRYKDGTLRDIAIHPELATDKRLVAVRFDGSLYFANVSYFEDAILAAEASNPDVKFILVVGDAINQLDASGEDVLRHLVERLKDTGVTLVFSGLKRQIILVLKHTGTWNVIGDENIFATEEMALKNIYQRLS
ncbi:MAG: SulP family inorganic anion transporter, partial [Thiohalomonadales bacterium]